MRPISGKDKSTYPSRGEFLSSSAKGLGAILAGIACASGQTAQNSEFRAGMKLMGGFPFGRTYTREEAQNLLRPPRGLVAGGRVGLPFWWDREAKVLVNPTNNKFDSRIRPGDYTLQASILNFRASQRELKGDVWEKMGNNCQLNINPKSVSSEGDKLDWILMTWGCPLG
jgi:hypothetical protein